MFEIIVKKEGLEFLGWRQVPTHPDVLGHKAVEVMPCIIQAFIRKPAKVNAGIDFDRKLYVARRVFEQSNEDTYVVSLSSRTMYTRVCSWLDSSVPSSATYRIRIMNQPSPLYIPDSVRIHSRAG